MTLLAQLQPLFNQPLSSPVVGFSLKFLNSAMNIALIGYGKMKVH